MARKTIPIDSVRKEINRLLELPTRRISTAEKRTLCSLLEHFLMDSGNYQGFRWLMSTEKAKAVQPSDPEYYSRYYFGCTRDAITNT